MLCESGWHVCAIVTVCTWCGRPSGSWQALTWNTCPQKVWRRLGKTLVKRKWRNHDITPINNNPFRKLSFVEFIRPDIRGPRFYAWLRPEDTWLSKEVSPCEPQNRRQYRWHDCTAQMTTWRCRELNSLLQTSLSGEQNQSRKQGEQVRLSILACLGDALGRMIG